MSVVPPAGRYDLDRDAASVADPVRDGGVAVAVGEAHVGPQRRSLQMRGPAQPGGRGRCGERRRAQHPLGVGGPVTGVGPVHRASASTRRSLEIGHGRPSLVRGHGTGRSEPAASVRDHAHPRVVPVVLGVRLVRCGVPGDGLLEQRRRCGRADHHCTRLVVTKPRSSSPVTRATSTRPTSTGSAAPTSPQTRAAATSTRRSWPPTAPSPRSRSIAARKPRSTASTSIPTVRLGDEGNAAFDGNYKEETFTVRTQAARFGKECGVYAPLYRQRTLTAPYNPTSTTSAIAYADVLDAFRYYLGNLNQGRPFVLMGHSQGSGHLRRLITEEIDPNPKLARPHDLGAAAGRSRGCARREGRRRIVQARRRVSRPVRRRLRDQLLLVPLDVAAAGRTRSSPRARAGPAGGVHQPGQPRRRRRTVGVVLRHGSDRPAHRPRVPRVRCGRWPTRPRSPRPSSRCRASFRRRASTPARSPICELTANADPGPRADDIGGDLTPQWGMHLVDVNVALGNLIDLVGTQAKAWQTAHSTPRRSTRFWIGPGVDRAQLVELGRVVAQDAALGGRVEALELDRVVERLAACPRCGASPSRR